MTRKSLPNMNSRSFLQNSNYKESNSKKNTQFPSNLNSNLSPFISSKPRKSLQPFHPQQNTPKNLKHEEMDETTKKFCDNMEKINENVVFGLFLPSQQKRQFETNYTFLVDIGKRAIHQSQISNDINPVMTQSFFQKYDEFKSDIISYSKSSSFDRIHNFFANQIAQIKSVIRLINNTSRRITFTKLISELDDSLNTYKSESNKTDEIEDAISNLNNELISSFPEESSALINAQEQLRLIQECISNYIQKEPNLKHAISTMETTESELFNIFNIPLEERSKYSPSVRPKSNIKKSISKSQTQFKRAIPKRSKTPPSSVSSPRRVSAPQTTNSNRRKSPASNIEKTSAKNNNKKIPSQPLLRRKSYIPQSEKITPSSNRKNINNQNTNINEKTKTIRNSLMSTENISRSNPKHSLAQNASNNLDNNDYSQSKPAKKSPLDKLNRSTDSFQQPPSQTIVNSKTQLKQKNSVIEYESKGEEAKLKRKDNIPSKNRRQFEQQLINSNSDPNEDNQQQTQRESNKNEENDQQLEHSSPNSKSTSNNGIKNTNQSNHEKLNKIKQNPIVKNEEEEEHEYIFDFNYEYSQESGKLQNQRKIKKNKILSSLNDSDDFNRKEAMMNKTTLDINENQHENDQANFLQRQKLNKAFLYLDSVSDSNPSNKKKNDSFENSSESSNSFKNNQNSQQNPKQFSSSYNSSSLQKQENNHNEEEIENMVIKNDGFYAQLEIEEEEDEFESRSKETNDNYEEEEPNVFQSQKSEKGNQQQNEFEEDTYDDEEERNQQQNYYYEEEDMNNENDKRYPKQNYYKEETHNKKEMRNLNRNNREGYAQNQDHLEEETFNEDEIRNPKQNQYEEEIRIKKENNNRNNHEEYDQNQDYLEEETFNEDEIRNPKQNQYEEEIRIKKENRNRNNHEESIQNQDYFEEETYNENEIRNPKQNQYEEEIRNKKENRNQNQNNHEESIQNQDHFEEETFNENEIRNPKQNQYIKNIHNEEDIIINKQQNYYEEDIPEEKEIQKQDDAIIKQEEIQKSARQKTTKQPETTAKAKKTTAASTRPITKRQLPSYKNSTIYANSQYPQLNRAKTIRKPKTPQDIINMSTQNKTTTTTKNTNTTTATTKNTNAKTRSKSLPSSVTNLDSNSKLKSKSNEKINPTKSKLSATRANLNQNNAQRMNTSKAKALNSLQRRSSQQPQPQKDEQKSISNSRRKSDPVTTASSAKPSKKQSQFHNKTSVSKSTNALQRDKKQAKTPFQFTSQHQTKNNANNTSNSKEKVTLKSINNEKRTKELSRINQENKLLRSQIARLESDIIEIDAELNRTPDITITELQYEVERLTKENNELLNRASFESASSVTTETIRAYEDYASSLKKGNQDRSLINNEMRNLLEKGTASQTVAFANPQLIDENKNLEKEVKKARSEFDFNMKQRASILAPSSSPSPNNSPLSHSKSSNANINMSADRIWSAYSLLMFENAFIQDEINFIESGIGEEKLMINKASIEPSVNTKSKIMRKKTNQKVTQKENSIDIEKPVDLIYKKSIKKLNQEIEKIEHAILSLNDDIELSYSEELNSLNLSSEELPPQYGLNRNRKNDQEALNSRKTLLISRDAFDKNERKFARLKEIRCLYHDQNIQKTENDLASLEEEYSRLEAEINSGSNINNSSNNTSDFVHIYEELDKINYNLLEARHEFKNSIDNFREAQENLADTESQLNEVDLSLNILKAELNQKLPKGIDFDNYNDDAKKLEDLFVIRIGIASKLKLIEDSLDEKFRDIFDGQKINILNKIDLLRQRMEENKKQAQKEESRSRRQSIKSKRRLSSDEEDENKNSKSTLMRKNRNNNDEDQPTKTNKSKRSNKQNILSESEDEEFNIINNKSINQKLNINAIEENMQNKQNRNGKKEDSNIRKNNIQIQNSESDDDDFNFVYNLNNKINIDDESQNYNISNKKSQKNEIKKTKIQNNESDDEDRYVFIANLNKKPNDNIRKNNIKYDKTGEEESENEEFLIKNSNLTDKTKNPKNDFKSNQGNNRNIINNAKDPNRRNKKSQNVNYDESYSQNKSDANKKMIASVKKVNRNNYSSSDEDYIPYQNINYNENILLDSDDMEYDNQFNQERQNKHDVKTSRKVIQNFDVSD